ncbi:hypothetical protein C7271_09455, partial [filamentous cyanobacterium CCP5]
LGDFEILVHRPLFSIVYEPPNYGNELVVSVSRTPSLKDITYAHPIVFPQTVEIVTDADGIIEHCRVTDDDRAQTIIVMNSR